LFIKKTITDQICDILRQKIIHLDFKPGERISIDQLNKEFNVSRAPVRDALRRLEQENLVLVKPQIGTFISPISLQKAFEISQIRLLLEPYAAEVAANNIGFKDQEIITQKFDQLGKIEGNFTQKRQCLNDADTLLHKTIWKLSGNEEICAILEGYRDQINRIRLTTARLTHRLESSEKEVKEIYHALMEKDPKRTREAMYTHLSKLKNSIKKMVDLQKNKA